MTRVILPCPEGSANAARHAGPSGSRSLQNGRGHVVFRTDRIESRASRGISVHLIAIEDNPMRWPKDLLPPSPVGRPPGTTSVRRRTGDCSGNGVDDMRRKNVRPMSICCLPCPSSLQSAPACHRSASTPDAPRALPYRRLEQTRRPVRPGFQRV